MSVGDSQGQRGASVKHAVLLSADVVAYSVHIARDRDTTIARLLRLRWRMAHFVGMHEGRVVDVVGDNLLAEFPCESAALRCAIAIQRAVAADRAKLPEGQHFELRIGLHAGEVSELHGALYGTPVNAAARLEASAPPGGICMSASVAEQLDRILQRDLRSLGERTLKNIPGIYLPLCLERP